MAESDPLGKSWKLWGGILAFITAVIVLGLIFVPRSTPAPEAAPVTAPAPSVPVETSQPTDLPSQPLSGDCPALSTDTSFPNDAPATEWKRHPAGMLIPVSSEHGPAKQDGNFWRCFSHTPSGALYAGLTLLFDFSSGGVLEAAADSPERDELFEKWKNLEQTAEFPVISGFRVMSSSTKSASIEYIAPASGQYISTRVDVLWDANENDWRLDLSAGEPAWGVVSDLSSYTDLK